MTHVPSNQIPSQEKILFSKKYEIELIEKETTSKILKELILTKEVKINNDVKHTIIEERRYDEILRSLEAKIKVLHYISDNSFDTMKKEILFDLVEIMFKLEKKEKW